MVEGQPCIALASCAPFPPVEDDEGPLREGFEALGYTVVDRAWDAADVDWSSFDAVILRMTWDYADRLPEFLTWAERTGKVTRLIHDIDIVRWNTDKAYLRVLSEGDGFSMAPTLWLERGTDVDLATLLAGVPWTRGFIKPRVGASARETLRFDVTADGIATAQQHVGRLLPDESLILQAYLPSVEHEGELSAFFVAGALTHGVRKVPSGNDYRVQEDFGAKDYAHQFEAHEAALATAIVEAAERRLGTRLVYARVDFIRDASGQLLLNELEVVEPCMFFRHGGDAGQRFADAVHSRLAQ
jgi:glutathione synthase/RimK-type ligase-like ATP-grasp enzyme